MVEEFNNGEFAFAARIDNLKEAAAGNTVIDGCEVTANITPDLFVDIAAGRIFIDGATVVINAVDNQAINAADGTNDRFDIIYVGANGTVDYAAGTPATNPFPPNLPADHILLAVIFVENNITAIDSGDIADSRITDDARIDLIKLTGDSALTSTLENKVRLIRVEADLALGTQNWEAAYADYFSDATGFYNAINTGGSTTMIFSGAGEFYGSPTAITGVLFSDDFTDAGIVGWTNAVGTWANVSNALKITSSTANAGISHDFTTFDFSTGLGIQFTAKSAIKPFSNCFIGNNIHPEGGTFDGYAMSFISGTRAQFDRRDNGANTTLIDNSSLTIAVDDIWVIERDGSGNWEVFQNGSSIGTASDSTYTDGQFVGFAGTSAPTNQDAAYDDVFIGTGVGFAAGVLETVNLGTTFFEPSTNINKVYVYTDRTDLDAGGTITVDISVDGGSNFVTTQNLNEWIELTANLGTQLVLKINAPAVQTELHGFAVYFDTE